jgi:hypothetical protein
MAETHTLVFRLYCPPSTAPASIAAHMDTCPPDSSVAPTACGCSHLRFFLYETDFPMPECAFLDRFKEILVAGGFSHPMLFK